jgi:hypothetical protein
LLLTLHLLQLLLLLTLHLWHLLHWLRNALRLLLARHAKVTCK